MFYKPLLFLILFSFLNYTFIGCSIVRIRQLNEIQPNDKIRNVITPSGENIRFDYKDGYHYMLEEPGIAGISNGGFWAALQMKYIKEIRRTSPKIIKSKKQLRNQKIIELITFNYDLVQFDSAGGIYVDSDKTIKGFTQNGKEEIYKLNSIIGCRIELPEIISKDHLFLMKDQFIAEVVTNDNKLIIFDRRGGMFVEVSNVLVGYTMKGSLIRLDQNQIETVYINHPFLFGPFIIGTSLGLLFFYYKVVVPSTYDWWFFYFDIQILYENNPIFKDLVIEDWSFI